MQKKKKYEKKKRELKVGTKEEPIWLLFACWYYLPSHFIYGCAISAADGKGYGVTTEHQIYTFVIMHGYIPDTLPLKDLADDMLKYGCELGQGHSKWASSFNIISRDFANVDGWVTLDRPLKWN